MGIVVTAWRLGHPGGRRAECTVSERDGRWQLIVHEGRRTTLTQRCESDEAALARADEIWKAMVAQGWTEPRH